MAAAFSDREREAINQSLIKAALQSAASGSMKSVTVEKLAYASGISKGAFYSFYESKEHLFLAMLERIHNEMYSGAEKVLETHPELPIRERTALSIKEVFSIVEKYNMMPFIRDEVPLLLRRLPPKLLMEHYQSEDELIRRLIVKADVKLTTSIDVTCAVIRLLMMTLLVKREVGELFPAAARLVINGACDQLLAK